MDIELFVTRAFSEYFASASAPALSQTDLFSVLLEGCCDICLLHWFLPIQKQKAKGSLRLRRQMLAPAR